VLEMFYWLASAFALILILLKQAYLGIAIAFFLILFYKKLFIPLYKKIKELSNNKDLN